MSNFFIAIAVFLITIIGALFAVPYFIDWNGYRGVFEEEATRLLGREVRVGGAVNLHLLPTPYFRFEKVRIADTSVNLQEPFFRTESLTIKLSIPPMVRGVVEANEIELQRPVLRLALDDNDGWNWQSFGQVLGGAAYLPANVALTSVKIADGALAAARRPTAPSAHASRRSTASCPRRRSTAPTGSAAPSARPGAERELRLATARPEPDGTVRFKAILRGADGGLDLHAGRAPRRPHGQAARRRRAHRAAADRRAVAGAAAAACPTPPKRRRPTGRGQAGHGRAGLRPEGQRSTPIRPAQPFPISRWRSSRAGGRSSSPAR